MPELTPGLIEDKIIAYTQAKAEFDRWVGMLGTSDAGTRGDDMEKDNLNNAFKAFEDVHKDVVNILKQHKDSVTVGALLRPLDTLVGENEKTFKGESQHYDPGQDGRKVGAVKPRRM